MFDSWVADAYKSDKTAYWENYFERLAPETSVFFFDTPEVAMFDYHRDYWQYFNPAGFEIGRQSLQALRLGEPDTVIVRSDTLAGREDGLFDGYTLSTTTYKYSILVKK